MNGISTPVGPRLRSTGVVRYSPKLLGGHSSDKWWVVIDCDPEIGKYMRCLYRMASHGCKTLQRPAWKEHITVIRDEEPDDDHKPLWHAHDGMVVEFDVELVVKDNGVYFWLPVTCEKALEIREELGLSRAPHYPLHLSIGHNKDADFSA